jgi:adenylylsulfate kinase
LKTEILDGDQFRRDLSPDLGYEERQRNLNVRRLALIASMLARHGVAAISPFRRAREDARQVARSRDLPFLEVRVHARIETLVARDVKGLYRRALSGEITQFTGVSHPYETPLCPDLAVDTERPLADCPENVLDFLKSRGLF